MPEHISGEDYNHIKSQLELQKIVVYEVGIQPKTVLNFHIPGTGGRSFSRFPTREALKNLEDSYHHAACVYLEGVGSSGEGYIAPVIAATNSLGAQVASWKKKLGRLFFGSVASVTSNPDHLADGAAVISPKTAQVAGIVYGSGKEANIERIINTLETLDKNDDGSLLPDVVHLSGHSRGAIACISAANAIWKRFGNRVKVHLTLTDPVPGPLHWHDVEEKVIPPNVVSCNIFYADNEDGIFFAANDVSRLVFTNPTTNVNCYSAQNTDHGSVLGHEHVINSIYDLTLAINGVENNLLFSSENKGIDNIADMKGKTWIRNDAHFYKTTPVNNECSTIHTKAIAEVRNRFENTPMDTTKKEIIPFKEYNILDSRQQRKRFLYNCYREAIWQRSHVSYGEMIALITLVPTLGLSANIYCATQNMALTSRWISFFAGLGSLNIAPTLDLLSNAGRKLGYNLVHKGIFRPTLKKRTFASHDEEMPLMKPHQ